MRLYTVVYCLALLSLGTSQHQLLSQDADPREAAIRQFSTHLTDALNQGKFDDVAAMFVETGELIDEEGVVHSGREEIKTLLKNFGAKFPKAVMSIDSESIRFVGPLAIDDGIRIITNDDGATSLIRYTAVLVEAEGGWKIASVRDFPDELPATPGELLQDLSWLVGEWINEGSDGRVKMTYQWSEDKNFIVGELVFSSEGHVISKSSQRIGWDPLRGKPRSWLFDSDGGFSEAIWTPIENGWLMNSTAVMPDAVVGSAMLKIKIENENRFTLSGTHRIVGNAVDEDFELQIVRRLKREDED